MAHRDLRQLHALTLIPNLRAKRRGPTKSPYPGKVGSHTALRLTPSMRELELAY